MYKFLNASLPIRKSPKDSMIDQFKFTLQRDFKISTDWYTIQYETIKGTGIYSNVDVRVNHAVSTKTGLAIGDDFKNLLFSDNSSHSVGSMFYFDGNYWITVNSEEIKNIANGCTVRRCNNMLRWKDIKTGKVYRQPCVIDYLIKETRDYSTAGSYLVNPSGFLEVMTQFNARSNTIQSNQRFIVGNPSNWVAYKLMGGGLNNFNNLSTEDNMSAGLLRLSMLSNQYNEDSDGIDGIADVNEYMFDVALNYSSLTLEAGKLQKISAAVSINDKTSDNTVVWTSSNPLVASVDSSGVVTALSVGTSVIRCSIYTNEDVYALCSVNVVSALTNNYSIVVSPNVNYVYEGEEKIFTVNLFYNNVLQLDVFSFSIVSAPSSEHYEFLILDGNRFKVRNIKKSLTVPILVSCTSGINTDTIEIKLLGGW